MHTTHAGRTSDLRFCEVVTTWRYGGYLVLGRPIFAEGSGEESSAIREDHWESLRKDLPVEKFRQWKELSLR